MDANGILMAHGADELRRRMDAAHVLHLRPKPADAKRDDEQDDTPTTVKSWPTLCSKTDFGIVGEIAKLATKNSEADPAAVIATALCFAAATFGRARFTYVGDTVHHARINATLVGASSRARKGTSLAPVERLHKAAQELIRAKSTLPFPLGNPLRISHGPLSTGEGLINAIRDKNDEEDSGGTEDKRILCIEGEFGSVLRMSQRTGNSLSTILRTAWDGGTIAPLTKANFIQATHPHVGVCGHVTGQELRALLSQADVWNGFGNRFLWLAVRRSKSVPFPTPMHDQDVARIATELARVYLAAHGRLDKERHLPFTQSAREAWVAAYPDLTRDAGGIVGVITSRAEAQALRLAMTFALLDGADEIQPVHVGRSLAFWEFCRDSAEYIFEGAELDPVAAKIIEALASGDKSQNDIRNLFSQHESKAKLDSVLKDLQERGRITLTLVPTTGRPRKLWSLI